MPQPDSRAPEDLPVAFYGTLRPGERGFRELGLNDRVHDLGTCRLRGTLVDLGAYPGLLAGEAVITGDLFELPEPALLGELDYYELFDPARPATSEFIRRKVRLLSPDRDAWVYFYNVDLHDGPLPAIASGDWKRR